MKSNISKRILGTLFLISSLATAVSTTFQIVLEYQEAKQDQLRQFETFNRFALTAIRNSVWYVNTKLLSDQLDTSLLNEDFHSIHVLDENKKTISKKTNEIKIRDKLLKEIVLFSPDDDKRVIGFIDVELNQDRVDKMILNNIFRILLINIIKSIFLVFILYSIINRMTGKRLKAIYDQITDKNNRSDLDLQKNFKLGSDSKINDEITEIEKALSDYSNQINFLVNNLAKSAKSNSQLAEVGIFAAGVAHEINNPLAIIKGNADLMLRRMANRNLDNEMKSIDRIIYGCDRISKIVTATKNLVRQENIKEVSDHLLSDVVDELLLLTRSRLLENQIHLIHKIEDSQLVFTGSRIQLSQALVNLMNNSIDAIKNSTDKWIKIEISMNQNHEIVISFTDSGSGIPTDIAEKIFIPFFTTKPVGSGTGLGLSLTHSLVQSNQGQISLNMKSPHTQFLLVFPPKKKLHAAA